MTPRRVLLFALLAVLGLVVAGCGDDDGDQLATEEFFLELGALDEDYTAAVDDLEAEFDEAVEAATSFEEMIEASATFMEDAVVPFEDFVNGVEQLNAPDDLVEFQDRAVTAGREFIGSVRELVIALDDVTTQAGFMDAYDPVEEALERFGAICVEAQGLADDAGVDVTYNCGDDE